METIYFNCQKWQWDSKKKCYVSDKGKNMSKELMQRHIIKKTATCLTQE